MCWHSCWPVWDTRLPNRFQRGLIHIINGIYKWLPTIMGCHQKADRSFHWRNGLPFPVCARCTGILIGLLLAICTLGFWQPPVPASLLFLLPMTADGLIQHLTRYESHNIRRLWTGLIWGYAVIALFVACSAWLFGLGVQLGTWLKTLPEGSS